MALETNIIEFPITQGQDEGTAVEVLPVGKFSALRNARFRLQNRLGKRNGYTSKNSLDAAGNPLGNGSGRLTTLGMEFCAVDDRFYQRDTVADAWATPPLPFDNGALAGTRLYGKWPQFLPAPALETLTVQSDLNLGSYTGTAQDSVGGMTVAIGYLWTCCSYYSATAGTWLVRVNAIDATTGKVVWRKDVDPTTATPATVRQHPVLLATGNGNTLVLIYDHFTAGVKDGVRVRTLTSFAGGFSAEVSFACIQSAANYDPTTPGGILFVYTLTGSPATFTIARMNPVTMTTTAHFDYFVGGNKTKLSCFCNSAGLVWVGYTDAGVFVQTFDATLAPVGGSANFVVVYAANGAQGAVLFATRTASTVCAVTQATAITGLNAVDVDSSGGLGNPITQYNAEAVSQPFAIGSQIFIWSRYVAGAQLGVATLLRIPLASEYANNNVSPYVRSFPIEATVDDRNVDAPLAVGSSGPTFPLPLSASLGYIALINYTRSSIVASGSAKLLRGFLLAPVRHRSEGLRYATSCVVPCAGKQFVAGAQPMWVDQLGQYEAGFIQAPVSTAAIIVTAGGALTANSTYSYTAVFESLDANGLIERSAPALPVTGATTVNTTMTVKFTNMQFGMRRVRCKVYRTAANGSVFYLVNSVDASPGGSVLSDVTFVDVYADSDIIQNEALYINVGQGLAASNFPACSFANTGGNRLWVGGGFSGSTVTASKPFMPHLAPEFADDDAFRITLPAPCTGAAWCDSQVLFTQEGIYVVGGDGPDGSGSGFFTVSRLPFDIGCIDWRSVDATDAGIFFQSARGLYLLPRGFGPPISMNNVLDTLSAYPIITSARSSYNSQGGADNSEQVVQWTAVTDEAATSGVVITYDIAYSAFSVDTCNADYPATFQTGWEGDSVQSPQLMTVGPNGASKWHPFRVRDTSHSDGGLTVDMSATTGDIRPWGTFAHGVVNRVGVLGSLGSACTVNVTKLTDKGTRTTSRVYTGVAPDYVPGDDVYLDVELGNTEQRDVTALRFTFAESSAVEGMAFIGMIIETDEKPQGFRLLKKEDRVV